MKDYIMNHVDDCEECQVIEERTDLLDEQKWKLQNDCAMNSLADQGDRLLDESRERQ